MGSLKRRHLANLLALGLVSGSLWGCTTSSGGESNTGGTTSSGGTLASGGSGGGSGGTSSTGGSSATGGSKASGGSVTSGGSKGSGGVGETGGTVGSGGSDTGGTEETGGSSSGGAVTGGSTGGGGRTGRPNTGGARTGGTTGGGGSTQGDGGAGGSGTTGPGSGGSGTGGSTGSGSGGSTSAGSPGCDSASPLKTGNFTESINGTNRKWMLDVPNGYDGSKPYRLIFVWHPLGGSGSQVVSGGYNGLKSLSNSTTIFATADGLNGSNSEASGTGWWNANGGDMKLFQAMLDKINNGLCIDQERIFSTGFSFGGMMSYTLPFEFDVFRAVAPCSGKTGVIPYDDKFDGPVPIMAFHGNNDTFVATSLGKAFFDKFRTRNKCGNQTKPVDPSPCVEYQDCIVPSIWCEFPGQHQTWSEEPQAIWKFFSQF